LICCFVICCSSKGKNDGVADSTGTKDKLNGARILRRGLPGEPRTLDPQLAEDTFSFPVLRDLYEGLTAEDPSGQIVPGAAESWTVDGTGTVYTFYIRPNAKWSDGEQTTAAEFVRGLQRAVDPQTASGSSAQLTVIKSASDVIARHKKVSDLGVTAIGTSSVRIELEHPAPFVLQILSQPIAAPLHIHATRPVNGLIEGDTKVSNGPYSLVRRIPGSYIELARNPEYWDASNVKIEHVKYINAESEATEIREYIAGEVDMTSTIPAPDLQRLSQRYGAEIQTAPILGTLYLALNVSKPPLRDDRNLRQALSMAVDRDLIAKQVTVGVTPAYTFVAKGISGGYDAPAYEWSEWSRDRQIAFAQSLYSRAGYSGDKPLHLTLYFNSGESIQRIMIAIAASWRKNLGVVTDLVSDEFRVFLAGRKDRSRWDVARLGWYADYDDAASFLEVFARNNSQNDPGYMSLEFNNLIEEAHAEANPKKRILLLQQSEQTLLNDYPIIPVYFYTARRLVKPYLRGAEITPLNHTYSKHLYWNKAS
jgi:oligopeptide transport system substrate-binding protein